VTGEIWTAKTEERTPDHSRKVGAFFQPMLQKAWAGEDVNHRGKFWKESFPILRPRPYHKPRPPLVRARISEASILRWPR